MRHALPRAALVLLGLCASLEAPAAQKVLTYPARAIRLIVANTTGTSVDTLARVLAAKSSEERPADRHRQPRRRGRHHRRRNRVAISARWLHPACRLHRHAGDFPADLPQAQLPPVGDFEPILLYAVTQNAE